MTKDFVPGPLFLTPLKRLQTMSFSFPCYPHRRKEIPMRIRNLVLIVLASVVSSCNSTPAPEAREGACCAGQRSPWKSGPGDARHHVSQLERHFLRAEQRSDKGKASFRPGVSNRYPGQYLWGMGCGGEQFTGTDGGRKSADGSRPQVFQRQGCSIQNEDWGKFVQQLRMPE